MSELRDGKHDCGAFLRHGLASAIAQGHAGESWHDCGSCRKHVDAARALLPALRQKPQLPTELMQSGFLEGVQERIVQHAQADQTGQFLADGLKIPPPELPAELRPGVSLAAGLAQSVRALPKEPSQDAWEQLRSQVWRQVRHQGSAARLPATRYALAGIAAAAILMTFLLQQRNTEAPTIVFTDVATIPGSQFSPMSILRGR